MEPNQPTPIKAPPLEGVRPNSGNVTFRDAMRRVVIEGVSPQIDSGKYAVKRVPGERVVVEADAFADGHDLLTVILKSRHENETAWAETQMIALGNDRWRGEFSVTQLGEYRYTIEGWIDHYKSWRSDLLKRIKAGQDISGGRMVRMRKNCTIGPTRLVSARSPLWVRAPNKRLTKEWRRWR
jgi:hypothetical protein